MDLNSFSQVWLADFEFVSPPGEPPRPLCMVARELHTGQTLRLWEDELRALRHAPFPVDGSSVMVAYYSSAELGCFLSLDWAPPENVLDLYVEFRNRTNGLKLLCDRSLLGALTYFGLDGMGAAEKGAMRQLALRGGPYTPQERTALLDYCEQDVLALDRLLPVMAPAIDWTRALVRGRYMAAAARIEANGVSIDMPMLNTLRNRWTDIEDHLIRRVDADFGVYDGRTFKTERFAGYLAQHDIPWPTLPSGMLDLKDDTFKDMSQIHPILVPLRELRVSLSRMRLADLQVGSDGRNRCLLSAFSSVTGRNQPSSAGFIFGPAVWLRGLIRPAPGWAIAYIDYGQQEFGIAAALSGDKAMREAYASGDPYLAFAKQAGAAPPEATKVTHGAVREQFKQCVLAVQYGMGAESLAIRIGRPPIVAYDLLQRHRQTYPRFWVWSDGLLDYAMLRGDLWTTFGWHVHVGPDANGRSLRNFPMQANGAEMLRLACISMTEAGIRVTAPVHDAVLIEAPADRIDAVVAEAQGHMAAASRVVLNGFELRSDAKIVRYPDQYMDERGVGMWNTVQDELAQLAAGR